MTTQLDKATTFKGLHVKGKPVIIFNIWDPGSARAVQDAGAQALGTGSWSVAAAHGFTDGEHLPIELALANVERICKSVDLPVTLDFEGGYAESADELGENIARVIRAGAIGINFEDQVVGGTGLYSIDQQSYRIRAVREAATGEGIPLFINARTDVYLKADPAAHGASHLEDAAARANAYSKAGADGFFAPGLRNAAMIGELCQRSPLPVNIMAMADTPSTEEMARLGVGRISYGPGPFRKMIEALKNAAKEAFDAAT